MKSQLFEPDDNSERHLLRELHRILSSVPMDESQRDELVVIFYEMAAADKDFLSDEDILSFSRHCVNVTERFPNHPNVFLVLLASKCLGYGPAFISISATQGLAQKIIAFGQRLGIDIGKGLVEAINHHCENPSQVQFKFRELARYLFEHDVIHFDSVIDIGALVERVEKGIEFRSSRGTNVEDPTDIGFWFDLYTEPNQVRPSDIERILKMLYNQVFCSLPDDQIGKFAIGITYEIDEWLRVKFAYLYDRKDATWAWLAPSLKEYFELIAERTAIIPEDKHLQLAYFRYGWRVLWPTAEDSVQTHKKALLERCSVFFGHLRAYLKQSTTQAESVRDWFKIAEDALNCMLTFGHAWPVLKHLLQCLRNASVPCIASDLRYWNEPSHEEQPPEPWNWIPTRIAAILHNYLGPEQENDPELQQIRNDFSNFCLERLKTKKNAANESDKLENDDFIEPSPIWRVGYIHSIKALRVNPKGSSHHILHFSKNSDPDPSVRDAAKIAYKEIRHEAALPEGMSPKTPLFAAVWWLRQAHFVSIMGIDRLDTAGAQRTYYKEVRRTKEKEQS